MAMLFIAPIVVVVLGLLVLVVRVGIPMLLMAVAIVVMALLVARHYCVVESPAANTRSATDQTRHGGGTRRVGAERKTRSGGSAGGCVRELDWFGWNERSAALVNPA